MIFGIWLGGTLPEAVPWACMQTWGPERRLFTLQDEIEAMAPVLRGMRYWHDALHAEHWAGASDVARLALLWHLGGIYLDTDVEVVQPWSLRLTMFDAFARGLFVAGEETPGGDVCGAVMIAPPCHPFVGEMLWRYHQTKFVETFQGTVNGTTLLTAHARRPTFANYGATPRIVQPSWFYPWHWTETLTPTEKMERAGKCGSLAAHHWLGSWVEK